MGHSVWTHMGKERLIYYRGEVGTVQGARSFPETRNIVFRERDVRCWCEKRERNVLNKRATQRAPYRVQSRFKGLCFSITIDHIAEDLLQKHRVRMLAHNAWTVTQHHLITCPQNNNFYSVYCAYLLSTWWRKITCWKESLNSLLWEMIRGKSVFWRDDKTSFYWHYFVHLCGNTKNVKLS